MTIEMEGPSVRQLKNICVFCGARYGKGSEFVEAASNLGRTLAEKNIHVVYGGGSCGLMGAVSTAAYLGGSQVLGIIPKALTQKNLSGRTIGEELQVSSFHERMARMLVNSDAFIVLPGGFGTLEEVFQIVSWAHLNIHNKPIGLLNVNNFFDFLLSFLDHAVEQDFILPSARQLIISATTVDELIDKLQAFVYEPDPAVAKIDWTEGIRKDKKKEKSKESSKEPECDLTLHL